MAGGARQGLPWQTRRCAGRRPRAPTVARPKVGLRFEVAVHALPRAGREAVDLAKAATGGAWRKALAE
jgi:hypothetical protein